MDVIITGGKGLIGKSLAEHLREAGHNVWNPAGFYFDVRHKDRCLQMIKEAPVPDVIIHCAGYTSMDAAEENQERCFAVNAQGTENIALCCKELDIPMFYFSSDAVFDGSKSTPYTVDDQPNPISVYGKSKLAGEVAIKRHLSKYWILRTTWVYGSGRSNFITNAMESDKVGTIGQLSAPTYVNDLVKVVENLIDSKRYGLYHYTNEGTASRISVVRYIAKLQNRAIIVRPWKGKAARPFNACLTDNTGCYNRPWQDALKEFIDGANA